VEAKVGADEDEEQEEDVVASFGGWLFEKAVDGVEELGSSSGRFRRQR
jgi:hypothetical protein